MSVDEAKQAHEEARQAYRAKEAELKAALRDLEALQPRGLFSFFRRADPTELAEAEARVEALRTERRALYDEMGVMRQIAEEMEAREASSTLTTPLGPPPSEPEAGSMGVSRAAPLVGSLSHDEQVTQLKTSLAQLKRLAMGAGEDAALDRSLDRLPSGGVVPSMARDIRTLDAQQGFAEGWRDTLDQVEPLADALGLDLVLPRRSPAPPRYPHEPQASEAIAVRRAAAVYPDSDTFEAAVQHAIPTLDALVVACRDLQPAGTTQDEPPTTPEELAARWRDLRDVYTELDALEREGARTTAFLPVVERWHLFARQVTPMLPADLAPPSNDGAALADFIARLRRDWSALDARFAAWSAERGVDVDAAPAPASPEEPASQVEERDPAPEAEPSDLQQAWEELAQVQARLAALKAKGAGTLDLLDPMKEWQTLATSMREHPAARQHDLLPPINQGDSIPDFLERLETAWPALQDRARAVFAGG